MITTEILREQADKRIFISSTFDMYRERRALREMIQREFGWEAFCFELDDSSLLASLAASLQQVEDSDFCVVVFGKKYGTLIDTVVESFTIREVWRALATRKPTRVYIRRPWWSQYGVLNWVAGKRWGHERRLELALLPIKDEHIGKPYGYFDSIQALKRRVAADLRYWQMRSFPQAEGLYAASLLSKPIVHLAAGEAVKQDSIKVPSEVRDLQTAWELIHQLRSRVLQEDPVSIDRVCHQIARSLPAVVLDLPLISERREWLYVWAAFLEIFKWVHNCLAETDGYWGSVSLAKGVLQLYETLEDSGLYSIAVEGLAGCYYSKGDYPDAEKWYEFAMDRTETPPAMRVRASVLANKTRVLTRQSRFDEAIKLANRALHLGQDDIKHVGLTLGHLASLELRRKKTGVTVDAAQHFEEACKIVKGYPLSLIRIQRDWVEGLAEVGEFGEAQRLLSTIKEKCKSSGYWHQLWRLETSGALSRLRSDGFM